MIGLGRHVTLALLARRWWDAAISSREGLVAVGVLLLVGAGPFHFGLWLLRWAHLYRQRTGEGLGFMWVAMLLLMGAATLVAAAAVLACAARMAARRRFAMRVLAALIAAYVTAGLIFAFWVESHGRSCIGPCG